MSMFTSFSLVIVSILLVSLRASSTRPLGVVLHNTDPGQDRNRLLLDHLSDKNGTLSLREQQKGGFESNQESRDNVQDYKMDQEQNTSKKDIGKDGKMVKSQVDSSTEANPVSVSWHLPHERKKTKTKRKKKKKRGMSHDPEFTLDYAPPRVHPPCHN